MDRVSLSLMRSVPALAPGLDATRERGQARPQDDKAADPPALGLIHGMVTGQRFRTSTTTEWKEQHDAPFIDMAYLKP